MLTTTFKVFLRLLVRKKLLTFINVLGLSVGLASVLLLALYVQDEWSKDRQHPAVENKYRISTVINTGNEVLEIDTLAPPALPLLQANFSEIAETTRYLPGRFHVSVEGEADAGFIEDRIGFAEPNFASFFTLVWQQGDAATAWQQRNSIVLTESLARKYFPAGDALGKTLLLDKNLAMTVTGVIGDPALDSHVSLNAIVPMEVLRGMRHLDYFDSWFNVDLFSYVRLQPGASMESAWPAMKELLESSMPDMAKSLFDVDWQPVTDIYLDSRLNPGTQRTRKDDVGVLFGISLAILLVACINFINLATARSTGRQKEIAIRKVAGSGQGRIFLQHMLESLCLVLPALVLALGITELSLPAVNAFTGKQIALATAGHFWLSALGIGLATAVFAGAYPAFYLSGFRPLRILRQRQKERSGFFSFRNLLVMFQFAVAIVAIIAGSVMSSQLHFAQERELGFNADSVLVIENSPGTQWEVFKQQVLNRTDVTELSAALSRPFRSIATSMPVRYEGSAQPVENLSGFLVDFNYFELFDVDLIAGRTFSETVSKDRRPLATDDNPHPAGSVMLNLALVNRLGWTPETAVGRQMELLQGPGPEFTRSVLAEVIGVVDDMYVDSAQRSVVPQFFFIPTEAANFDFLFFRLNETNAQQQQAQIAAIWQELYPDYPANMYTLDGKLQQLYERESRQAGLLSLFAVLTVFISCMGLIALVTYATEQRMKEVGIRKTVGASVLQIVVLFSADFSKLVLVSNVIAWPIAYVAMQRWLENFAYRIDLTPLVFIGSGLIALCIAWVTVGGTAAKAASQKPVLALRYE